MIGIWLVSAVWAADVSALGILKAPTRPGCGQAWLMPTDPSQPTPRCVDLSALSAEQRETLQAHFDEEVIIEGVYVEGALSLRRIKLALGEEQRSLDYHLSPVAVSRSHDLSARLRDNAVSQVRIQTPSEPISFELIFQGVTGRENLAEVMEVVQFSLGGQPLVPETRSFGGTVVLVIPELPPSKLLSIEATDGRPLGALLSEELFGGDSEAVSLTMLLNDIQP